MCKAHSVSEMPATMHMKIWRGSVLLFLGGSDLLVSLSVSNRQFFSKWVFPNVVLNSYPFCMRLHANSFRLPSRSVLLGKGQGDKGDTQQGDMSHQQSSWSGGTFHFQASSSSLAVWISPNVSTAMKSFHEWLQIMWMVYFSLSNLFRSSPSCKRISVVLAGRASRVRDLIHFFTIHTLQKSRPPFNFTHFYQKPEVRTQIKVVVFHSVNLNHFLLQWSRLTPHAFLNRCCRMRNLRIETIFPLKPSKKIHVSNNTVDGWNPVPVDRYFIPLFSDVTNTSQVVQDFFHQQYFTRSFLLMV